MGLRPPLRSTAPPPLSTDNLLNSTETYTSPTTASPKSTETTHNNNKNYGDLPTTMATGPYSYHKRQDSHGSVGSAKSPKSPTTTGTSTTSSSSTSTKKPTVNVYSYCGRHSDQFLFGGWKNLWRRTVEKDDEELRE